MRIGQTSLHPEWRVVVERLRQLSYGEVITHGDLVKLTGLAYGSRTYYQQMRQAIKVLLREHEIVIVSVMKVGYKRLEPVNHGREARRYVRLGTRRIKRGGKVARATDVALLTDEQKRELENSMKQLALLAQSMNAMYRSMRGVLPPVQGPKALPPH